MSMDYLLLEVFQNISVRASNYSITIQSQKLIKKLLKERQIDI